MFGSITAQSGISPLKCGLRKNSMTKKYKPFPVGTVRGPFLTGTRFQPTVQFMVQGPGGWVPFNGKWCIEEAKTEQRAKDYAKKLLTLV
jgi:hypothetical protein